MNLSLLASLISVSLVLSPIIASAYSIEEDKLWCSQTPNPEPCLYFLNAYNFQIPLQKKSDFLKISIKLALERALHAKTNAYSLGDKCRNEKEKAAWKDCLELYEHTLYKLRKIYNPNTKHSQEDAQTWLSTALTNMETCDLGFLELGVSDYVYPMMSNNVTKLISNILSLNKLPNDNFYKKNSGNKNGFPKWVNQRDRKLLQSPSPTPSPSRSPMGSPARSPRSSPAPNVVVAADGSGNYKTLSEATVAAANGNGTGRYVIYVKAGVYSENVEVRLDNIMLLGDGIGKTIITGSKSVVGGSTSFRSATLAVVGQGFIARGITVRNTAGPQNHQAVALRSGSDHSVFYQCSFEGYQDTLYVYSSRQFYRECDIYGTVDFIFGNAAVVFQNCNIYVRNPPNKINTITAQGRKDPNQNTGISIVDCTVKAAPDLEPVQSSVRTYLGRPWKQYSRTVFMQTYLDSLINPAGWLEWDGNFALSTLYYGEYANAGPGSSTTSRVKWSGYHVITSAIEASNFSVANFISGDSWLPSTTVPFKSDL